MTTAPAKTRNFKPYLIGGFLSFVFCLIVFGRVFCAGACWNFGVAAVGAVIFRPIIGLPHAFLQFLFVSNPIPKSVRITPFGRSQGIGESLQLGLAFKIQPKDLQSILHAGSFALIIDPTNKVELDYSMVRVSGGCGLKFDPTATYQHYASTNDHNRHLLFHANDSEVFSFFYAKPNP